MTKRVIRRAEARQDIAAHAVYLGKRSPAAEKRFMAAVEIALQTLANSPFLGGASDYASPRLPGLRVCRVARFKNYLIYYLPRTDGIEVVRVLHAAQDADSIFEA